MQLEHENIWTEWKKDGCSVLAQPISATVTAALEKAKASQRKAIAAADVADAAEDSFSPEWDRLWSFAPADNMSGLDMDGRGLFSNLTVCLRISLLLLILPTNIANASQKSSPRPAARAVHFNSTTMFRAQMNCRFLSIACFMVHGQRQTFKRPFH